MHQKRFGREPSCPPWRQISACGLAAHAVCVERCSACPVGPSAAKFECLMRGRRRLQQPYPRENAHEAQMAHHIMRMWTPGAWAHGCHGRGRPGDQWAEWVQRLRSEPQLGRTGVVASSSPSSLLLSPPSSAPLSSPSSLALVAPPDLFQKALSHPYRLAGSGFDPSAAQGPAYSIRRANGRKPGV